MVKHYACCTINTNALNSSDQLRISMPIMAVAIVVKIIIKWVIIAMRNQTWKLLANLISEKLEFELQIRTVIWKFVTEITILVIFQNLLLRIFLLEVAQNRLIAWVIAQRSLIFHCLVKHVWTQMIWSQQHLGRIYIFKKVILNRKDDKVSNNMVSQWIKSTQRPCFRHIPSVVCQFLRNIWIASRIRGEVGFSRL